jgi:hypothetical protein
MAVKIGSLKSSASALTDTGTRIEVPEWPGVFFNVRPINSKDYQIAREMLVGKKTKSLGRMPTSPEMEPELGALVARHLLRGWEGLAGDDEKPIDYTPALGLQYMTDPEYQALETQVIWAAARAAEQDVEFTLDAAKN